MLSKRLIPVVALILLVTAIMVTGASQSRAVSVPASGGIVDSPNARAGDVANRQVPAAPALPDTSGPVSAVESVDFSNTTLAEWRNVPSAAGSWVAQDGRLQQRGDVEGNISDEGAVFVLSNVNVADSTVQAHVFPTSGEAVGLAFRGSDAGYYRVRLYQHLPNSSAKAFLERVTATSIETIATAPAKNWAGYKLGQWQLLSVQTSGSRLLVQVDGTTVFDVQDSAFASGWAGVYSTADMGAQFDNVRVLSSASQ